MNEKRVEKLSDLFPVREVQRAIKRDPDTFQVHRSNFYHMARLLALEDAIATSTRHSSNIKKLRAVNHVVVLAPCNADSVRFDLEA